MKITYPFLIRQTALCMMFCYSWSVSTRAADVQPVAPIRPASDDYFGTSVVDPYRWMEDLASPEVQTWMRQQADFSRSQLDRIAGREALLHRIHELFNADLARVRITRRGNRYFYEVYEPDEQLPKLYYRDGLKGEEHLLVDPAALGKGTNTHYSLDFYTPSWDGRYVAYGISAGGSEQSVLHLMQVDPLRTLEESIDRTSNSVVAWRPNNRSFFYLRYRKFGPNTPPSERMFNARTYLHTLSTRIDGEGDPLVFGRGVSASIDVPEGQGTFIALAPGSSYAIAVANHNMDDNPSTLYWAPLDKVIGPGAPWHKLADVKDEVTHFELRGDRLYFLSHKAAPNSRLLAVDLRNPKLSQAQVIVPERQGVLTGFSFAKDALYLRERDGASSRLLRVSDDGKKIATVPVPFDGTVRGPITDPRETGTLFNLQGWVHSPSVLNYDPNADTSTDTGLDPPSKVDASQMESREVFAISYDGTRVPLSIVFKKGLILDGSHPTVLEGYGAYGLTTEPYFDASSLAWLERGGVLATAHVRGGGEYGERWHLAGQKLSKLNTVFDLIACGQYLVDQNYTSPRLLAGSGESAGGITVGGALTWRPDLFGVILDLVGLSDLLRFETEPNGPPNVSEMGSVKTEAGFHGLYAMGAYQHIRNGVAYPATLLVTGANDPRVAPWHMLKMAARLQAASSSGKPILLRIEYDAGHGIGSSQSQYEAELADLWSFALWQMGDSEFALKVQ